jgi:hypothetical protein
MHTRIPPHVAVATYIWHSTWVIQQVKSALLTIVFLRQSVVAHMNPRVGSVLYPLLNF